MLVSRNPRGGGEPLQVAVTSAFSVKLEDMSDSPIFTTDAAMMARILPKDPDLETEDETYHTWHIQDWRKLKKKEHGPVFQCAGFPWWVHRPIASVRQAGADIFG